jgi:hypothetical protein
MGRTACTEPQWLYKGAFYLYNSQHINTDLTLTAFNSVYPKLTYTLEKEYNREFYRILQCIKLQKTFRVMLGFRSCNLDVTRNLRKSELTPPPFICHTFISNIYIIMMSVYMFKLLFLSVMEICN